MHIESIQIFRVPVTSEESGASEPGELESIVVGISSNGHIGWGEVMLGKAPLDHSEWSAGAFICLRDWMAPTLIGRTIASGQQLQHALQLFNGNAHAKAALDIAWWNLEALSRGKPLWEILGGQSRAIELSTTIGVQMSAEELFAAIRQAFSLGYVQVALQFRPGWEVEMVRAVRQEFPVERFAIDCDGGCSLSQQEMFFRLEDFFLTAIEQPLAADDLVGHAMLQQSLRTPISLHQSVTSPARVEQAIDLASCREMKVDLGRVGGLTPAIAIANACAAATIPCSVGATQPGLLATYAVLSLATLPAFTLPAEVPCNFEVPPWVLKERLDELGKNAEGKLCFTPSIETGVGILIDAKELAAAAIEHVTVR